MKFILVILLSLSAIVVTAQKMPVVKQVFFKKDSFSVVKYGAKADGITLNTKSINDAIDACSKKGGGVVAP